MHMYHIPAGTHGTLVDQTKSQVRLEDWTTRKDLTFSEVIVDPIIWHNSRGVCNLPNHLIRLVEKGYAIYGGADGNDQDAAYLLAVYYTDVKIQ